MQNTQVVKPNNDVAPQKFYFENLLTRDWFLVGLLFVGVLISRLPFQSEILYHWDSVNFAYAMREFDVAKEQPQSPGYIVYIWLSRLVDAVVGDAQATLVSISLISGALAVVALFYLGRSMFDRRVGLIGALFLAVSPLFWFYNEIALPHTLDTFLVIVSVWWLYETMAGDRRYLYPAVALLAVAGGVRQQTLIFLAPLLLFALRHVGWRRFIMAGILGAVICLAWFVPLVIFSDGLSNYLRVMGEFSRRFQSTTSVFMGAGWWGIRRNLIKLTLYTAYGWSLVALPAVIYVIIYLRQRTWLRSREKLIFLSLWILPALIFYSLIHMGQQGLIFVFLPALLMGGAYGLTRLLDPYPRWFMAATAIIIVTNAAIFPLAPEFPLGTNGPRLLSRATLINTDNYYQHRFQTIKENFAPSHTAILGANWHHIEYYLPEYTILPFTIGSKWEKNAGVPADETQDKVLADPVELGLRVEEEEAIMVVIFDPDLSEFNHTPDAVKQISLPDGAPLAYLELKNRDRVYFQEGAFGLLTK